MKTALLLLLLSLFLLQPVASQDNNYKINRIIGTPVRSPKDVAADKAGTIYILDGNFITKIDSTGKLLEQIAIDKKNVWTANFSFEVDATGNIYVSDANCKCVTKYNLEGQPLFSIGAPGTENGQFKSVGRVALDAGGNIYVADNFNKHIQKFDPQGRFLQSIGSSTSMGGTIHSVKDIGLDAKGNVYVLDSRGDYDADFFVHKFSPSGEPLQRFNVRQQGPEYNPNGASSFAVTENGGFYIVYSFYRQILHYDSNGTLLRKFAGHGTLESGLYGDYLNLALDNSGNLYASDDHFSEASIKKYSPEGTYLQKYGHDKDFSALIYDRWITCI